MIRPFLTLVFSSLLPFAPTLADEVDVYLLAGQSNMEGSGRVADLTPEQKAPAKDVYFWNGKSFEPLIPGKTITNTAAAFGPEISFATEIAKRNRKAFLIKFASSGKPLDSGWSNQKWLGDPPGTGRITFYPGLRSDDPNQGTLYKDGMLPRFKEGISTLKAAGHTAHIRGFLWMQGEQDAKNPISAGRYAESLKLLRDRLAADLGLSGPSALPMVFGQVLPHEPPLPRFVARDAVRKSQAAADMKSGLPQAIPFCRMVQTDGFPLLPDTVHYSSAGQFRLGQAFAATLAGMSGQPTPLR